MQTYQWFQPTQKMSPEMLKLKRHMKKLISQNVTDVIDPSRVFPMEFIFCPEFSDPRIEKSIIDRRSVKEIRSRQFITSLPVRAVFDRPMSVEARRLLNSSRNMLQTTSPTKSNRTNISRTFGTLASPQKKVKEEEREANETADLNELFKDYNNRLKCSKSKTRPFIRISTPFPSRNDHQF